MSASLWSFCLGGAFGSTFGAFAGKTRLLLERDFLPIPAFPEAQNAICLVRGNKDPSVWGVITLSQRHSEARCQIEGKIHGLEPGKYGIHLHEFGNLSDTITTAGGLYNPHDKLHGDPNGDQRTVGSLGNIECVAGEDEAIFLYSDWLVCLSGEHSVIGRSIIIHEKEDDFSHPNGKAGKALCSGVIAIAEPKA